MHRRPRIINSYLTSFYLISSLFSSILIMLSTSNVPKSYSLLPFVYFIIFIIYNYINKHFHQNNKGLLLFVANFIIYLRYVVIPLSYVILHGTQYELIIQRDYQNSAVLLMIYELIVIFFIISFFKNKSIFHKPHINQNKKNTFINLNLIFIIFVSSILLLSGENHLANDFDFNILNLSRDTLSYETEGYSYLLYRLLKISLFLYFFKIVTFKYSKRHRFLYVIIALGITFLFLLSFVSLQRWDFVFLGIACIYLLIKNFPEYGKFLTITTLVLLVFGFMSISVVKFEWILINSEKPFIDIIYEMFGMLNEYFSGPNSVASGISTVEIYSNQINVSTFINDFLGSVPRISDFVDQNNRINVYFNLYNSTGNTSLIMPLITVGYGYIGFLAPIFTGIVYYYLKRINSKLNNSNDSIETTFMLVYFGLFLTNGVGFNTQILFGRLIITFLPLYTLFLLNERVIVFRRNWNDE